MSKKSFFLFSLAQIVVITSICHVKLSQIIFEIENFFLVRKSQQWFGSHIFETEVLNLENRMVALSNAARAQKYRSENKEKNSLVMAIQNLKRSKLLHSGTPEAEKMRKAATLRKQLQRQRDREGEGRRTLRRVATGIENGGDS